MKPANIILAIIIAMIWVSIILIIFTSCTRYQWVATETKISTVGQKIHIEQIGKPVPIGDTTIRGMIITKKRMYGSRLCVSAVIEKLTFTLKQM